MAVVLYPYLVPDAGPHGLCPYNFAGSKEHAREAGLSFAHPVRLPPGKPDASVKASLCDFSESYWKARANFRAAGVAAGANTFSLEGFPEDETLTIDIAIVRGNGKGVVFHSSGVHGVEGYAGSAIQIAMLRHFGAHPGDAEPTIVFIHTVNPYGMAHFRR